MGNSCLPIDILVGCDHYWDLVTGSIQQSEKGPTAIHTKLGWVLSGSTSPSCHAVHFSARIATTHLLRVDSHTTELSQLTELNSSGHSGSLSPWLGIYEEEKTLYDEFVSNITFQDGRL